MIDELIAARSIRVEPALLHNHDQRLCRKKPPHDIDQVALVRRAKHEADLVKIETGM